MARGRKKKDDAVPVAVIEVSGPNYEGTVSGLSNEVLPLEEDSARIRGELSALHKKFEKEFGVNKYAVKIFHRLKRMSDDMRNDTLRSLKGLMQEDRMGLPSDLVDQMNTDDDTSVIPTVERSIPKLMSIN